MALKSKGRHNYPGAARSDQENPAGRWVFSLQYDLGMTAKRARWNLMRVALRAKSAHAKTQREVKCTSVLTKRPAKLHYPTAYTCSGLPFC